MPACRGGRGPLDAWPVTVDRGQLAGPLRVCGRDECQRDVACWQNNRILTIPSHKTTLLVWQAGAVEVGNPTIIRTVTLLVCHVVAVAAAGAATPGLESLSYSR